MTKTDVRLEFQKETGHSLQTINALAEGYDDMQEYIQWLEDKTMRFLLIKDMNDTMNNLQIMYPWGQSDQTNQK